MAVTPKELIAFLGILEKLKCNTRHSWTSTGRHETVAAHSWRLGVMALLLREHMPGLDWEKILHMCLIHDFGEAITGDIPSFEKSEADEAGEARAITALLSALPPGLRTAFQSLFEEIAAQITPEARVFKALDKMEAVIQHNEAPLATWLPLEYDLQQTYGMAEAEDFPYLKALRETVLRDTMEKIRRLEGEDGAP